MRVSQGTGVPAEWLFQRPGAECVDGLLSRDDRESGGIAAQADLLRATTAEAGTIRSAGAEWRDEHAERLPGPLHQRIARNELPVKLSEVRISADPLNSTARGALMAALC